MALTPEEARRIDCAVAEKVMGLRPPFTCSGKFEPIDSETSYCSVCCAEVRVQDEPGEHLSALKPYSTSITAAWEVVEKLTSDENILLEISPSKFHSQYEVSITFEDEMGDAMGPFYLIGTTAPHAICLAALKAVGHD